MTISAKMQGGNRWVKNLVAGTKAIIKSEPEEQIDAIRLYSKMSIKFSISLGTARKYVRMMQYADLVTIVGEEPYFIHEDKRKVILK